MSLLPRAAGGRRAQATTRKSGNLPTELADSTFEDKGDAECAALPGPWARGPYRLLPCSLAGEQGVFMCATAGAKSRAARAGEGVLLKMSGSRMSSWFRLLKMSKSPVSSWLRRSAAAILFVAVLAAAAGSVYAAGGYPVSIVDDTGMTIEIPREPVRIVSLAPSNTEILFALGLGDKVVGVTSACDYPEAAKKVDKVGDYNINIEAVVAKRPDLVVAVADLQMPVVQKLRELKLRVVAVNPRTLEEVFHAVEVIGDACGAGDAGRRMVDGLRARVAAVESKAATIPADSRPRVFVEIWNDPLMTAGAGTFVDDLVRRAGGRNVVGHIEGWPQISPETVLSAHTDFIILTCFNRAEVMARHEWRKVPAVVQGRVFEIHPDLMVRPGPRLVDGLEALARLFVSGQ